MLYFENDYCEGAHPAILQKLTETNFEKVSGYGTDPYCASAKEKIRAACACPEADVFFISGGTQANSIVIASTLRRWEGVVAAATGHVAGHEAGAIEFTGHKVIGLPQKNGKLDAATVEDFCKTFYADSNHDHMVFPGMVYISHPTEYGTLYSKAELEALSAVCHTYHMPLFVDGARLGYALVSEGTDVTLADLARLTDVFYIGGTKVGALCGEAVVFPHGAPAHFMTMVKQQGALLAKGRLMGIQFDVLFTDGLYTRISRNAIETANALKKGLAAKGYRFFMDSPTNQLFVVLENTQLTALEGKAKFGFWEKFDDSHTVVRIATSWATKMEGRFSLWAFLTGSSAAGQRLRKRRGSPVKRWSSKPPWTASFSRWNSSRTRRSPQPSSARAAASSPPAARSTLPSTGRSLPSPPPSTLWGWKALKALSFSSTSGWTPSPCGAAASPRWSGKDRPSKPERPC